jgi:hypothetical protein
MERVWFQSHRFWTIKDTGYTWIDRYSFVPIRDQKNTIVG